MTSISIRKRKLQDDLRSIRHENNVENSGDGISIPEKSPEPIILWGDLVERGHISQDDEYLKMCMKWPRSTQHRCHNCAYSFEGVPVPLPVHKDELRNIYFCQGNFCSWQCSKAFNLRETSPAGRGNRNMYIAVLAYRMWIKVLKSTPGINKKLKNFCNYKIDPAKPRFTLKDFGGNLTIEQYREGFCGVLPPENLIRETSPLLTLRKLAIVPFIDTETMKTSSSVKNTENEGWNQGIKRIETNRVQEFNNSFCERLRKAKADPNVNQMKRRKKRDDSNTLLSSMGIEIKKRVR